LRDGILYVRVLQPALHYELEQISKSEILRKLKQRFGGKTMRDLRFRVRWHCDRDYVRVDFWSAFFQHEAL
jgi:hypothetical protein